MADGNGTKSRFAAVESDVSEIKEVLRDQPRKSDFNRLEETVGKVADGFQKFQIVYAGKEQEQDGEIAAATKTAGVACEKANDAQRGLRRLILILAGSGVLGGGGIAALVKLVGN